MKIVCLRLVLFVLFVIFARVESFRKNINRFQMVLMASITNTTELLPQKTFLAIFVDHEQSKTLFGETPGLTGRHATPLATLFFIITMKLTGRHAMPVAI